MNSQMIETPIGKTWLDEIGILHAVGDPGAETTLADAQESLAAAKQLIAGRSVPFLLDMRGTKSITREARAYYVSPEATQQICAAAMLVDSPLSRTIANFFIAIHKPALPVRLFTAENKALEWLKEHL